MVSLSSYSSAYKISSFKLFLEGLFNKLLLFEKLSDDMEGMYLPSICSSKISARNLSCTCWKKYLVKVDKLCHASVN